MNRIRVLLADDHETVRHGLQLLIDEQPDMEVVGEAGTGYEAASRARMLAPAVVVMDVSMPEMNGLAATRAIKASSPATAVVALTRHGDDAYVKALLDAGASAYVLKQSATAELLLAIRAVAAGGQHLDAAIAARAAERTLDDRVRTHQQRPALTSREQEVLRLMALGHSNKEIANALAVTVKTVEVHKANAMRKLALRGRIDVVRYAVLQGWLQDA